eukprot:1028225-Prorocentrum_minimum.AAC.3
MSLLGRGDLECPTARWHWRKQVRVAGTGQPIKTISRDVQYAFDSPGVGPFFSSSDHRLARGQDKAMMYDARAHASD